MSDNEPHGQSDNNEVKKYIRAILGEATPTHPIYRFYERMEYAIYQSGYSKMEISRLTGINRRKFSDKCINMDLVELMRFCYYTGISADWLLGLTSVRPPNQYYKNKITTLAGIDLNDYELSAVMLETKDYRKKHKINMDKER